MARNFSLSRIIETKRIQNRLNGKRRAKQQAKRHIVTNRLYSIIQSYYFSIFSNTQHYYDFLFLSNGIAVSAPAS